MLNIYDSISEQEDSVNEKYYSIGISFICVGPNFDSSCVTSDGYLLKFKLS